MPCWRTGDNIVLHQAIDIFPSELEIAMYVYIDATYSSNYPADSRPYDTSEKLQN